MKYIDTSIENIDRLKKAREHINTGATFISFCSFICLFLGFFKTLFFYCSIFFIVLCVGLMVKREIFSIMIYLKEVDKDG